MSAAASTVTLTVDPGPIKAAIDEFTRLIAEAANAAEGPLLAEVCARHGIRAGEDTDWEWDGDEERPVTRTWTAAEALANRLAADAAEIERLRAEATKADKEYRALAAKERENRQGRDSLLQMIDGARALLGSAGYDCNEKGWLSALNDALNARPKKRRQKAVVAK